MVRIGKETYEVPDDVAREIDRLRKCEAVSEYILSRMAIDAGRELVELSIKDRQKREHADG